MNSIQQSKLFEVAEALESIIHALYRLSADGLPTIVIVDQWSHRTIRQGPKPSNLLCRSTASGLYYSVSRHYSLPLWSFKRVLWSEFARVHQAHFITRLLRYGTHPDFGYHLFVSDLLALALMNSLKKCNDSHHKSYKDVPSPYFSTSHMTEGVCDPLKQPRLDAFPISTFTPSNLHEFESNLTGWTDFIDHHNVPGFIINNFATNVTLSFPLNYVDISELEGEILKVMYLKTYNNAGRFQVYICGKKLKRYSTRTTIFAYLSLLFIQNNSGHIGMMDVEQSLSRSDQ